VDPSLITETTFISPMIDQSSSSHEDPCLTENAVGDRALTSGMKKKLEGPFKNKKTSADKLLYLLGLLLTQTASAIEWEYFVTIHKMNFFKSKAWCVEQYKGTLFWPEDAAEKAKIESAEFINALPYTTIELYNPPGGHKWFWVGLTRSKTD
jgi:hypothetical protein